MSDNIIEYSAKVEMPDTGEVVEIVGVSEQEVEDKLSNLFDYGLDENGIYVGDEAD